MNNVNASNKNESNAANEAWNRREGETCLQLIEEIASNSEDPKVFFLVSTRITENVPSYTLQLIQAA